jgi:hypothetical protein
MWSVLFGCLWQVHSTETFVVEDGVVKYSKQKSTTNSIDVAEEAQAFEEEEEAVGNGHVVVEERKRRQKKKRDKQGA